MTVCMYRDIHTTTLYYSVTHDWRNKKIFIQNRHEFRFLPKSSKFVVLPVKRAPFPAASVNVAPVVRH